MSKLKNILVVLIFLALIALVAIFLNPGLIGQKVKAPDTTSKNSSSSSANTVIANTIQTKNNKTIEVIPKDPKAFVTTTSKFEPSQVSDKEFAGISGAQVSRLPGTNDTSKVNFYTVNSTFPMTDASKTELEFFKNFLDKNQQFERTELFRLLRIFRSPDEIGGYQKELQNDLEIPLPTGVQKLRSLYTYDGVQFPSPPTITILGQASNDYFLIEYRLQDIDHTQLFKSANEKCGTPEYTVNDCTKKEYYSQLAPLANPQYLLDKANEAINLFKF
jgi:hypothetical protein